MVLGRVHAVCAEGGLTVDFAGNPAGAPVAAQATARYDPSAEGRTVALLFVAGDPRKPIAIGLVRDEGEAVPDRLVFTAREQVELRCGEASIVLTRAGKILVRGSYLSLRSTGLHRITGAAVHIN